MIALIKCTMAKWVCFQAPGIFLTVSQSIVYVACKPFVIESCQAWPPVHVRKGLLCRTCREGVPLFHIIYVKRVDPFWGPRLYWRVLGLIFYLQSTKVTTRLMEDVELGSNNARPRTRPAGFCTNWDIRYRLNPFRDLHVTCQGFINCVIMCGHCAVKPSSTQYFDFDKVTAPLTFLRDEDLLFVSAVAGLVSIRGDRVWDLADRSRVDWCNCLFSFSHKD